MDAETNPKPKRLVTPPSLYQTPTYRALRLSSRAMLEGMVRLARRKKADGWISLSVRGAADLISVTIRVAHAALRQLEEFGFLVCLERGRYEKKRVATTWRITCLPALGEPASREYEKPEFLKRAWKRAVLRSA
jgi:hypothetical protein